VIAMPAYGGLVVYPSIIPFHFTYLVVSLSSLPLSLSFSELQLDLNFHSRWLDCASKGSVEKIKKIEQFVEKNHQNEVRKRRGNERDIDTRPWRMDGGGRTMNE